MANKISSGIWFVCIGLLLLLHNLDIVHFNIWVIVKYWPLGIILIGINLMVQNKMHGDYIKIACNVLFLGWIVFQGLTTPSTGWGVDIFGNKNLSFGDEGNDSMQTAVSLPYSPETQRVKLDFNGGASKFEISSSDTDLLSAKSENESMGLSLSNKTTEQGQTITLNAKPKEGKNSTPRTASLQLHTAPLWDMEFNYGAADLQGDLSDFKINQLEINTGASTMNLKLGMPQVAFAKISIATGASTIKLSIPKEAAIRVKYSSIASSNHLEGFENNNKGLATTANFDTADKKFDIELDGAANTFTISRY